MLWVEALLYICGLIHSYLAESYRLFFDVLKVGTWHLVSKLILGQHSGWIKKVLDLALPKFL